MATSSGVDWGIAQGLYLQGVPTAEIARQLKVSPNHVRTVAHRKGWGEIREGMRRAVHKLAGPTPDMESLAQAVRERLMWDAERTLKALERKDPTKMGLAVLESRERVANQLQKRIWATFGFEEGKRELRVNVAVLHTLSETPATPHTPPQSIAQTIEQKVVAQIEYNQHCAKLSPQPVDTQKDALSGPETARTPGEAPFDAAVLESLPPQSSPPPPLTSSSTDSSSIEDRIVLPNKIPPSPDSSK